MLTHLHLFVCMQVALCFVNLLMAFTSSELKAAALLVLAVWLLVPLFKKLCRAVSNERKLRHLPGPQPGLFGVAPILKVLAAKAILSVCL